MHFSSCWMVGPVALTAAIALLIGPASATMWYAGVGKAASDANPGTAERPVATVAKAVSLARPGDTVIFLPGVYSCSGVQVPDGRPDLPITLRAEGNGGVIFANDGSEDVLLAGSYNTIDRIEIEMDSEHPTGAGLSIVRKEHVAVRNSRFFACQEGVRLIGAHHVSIENCEMAYSGAYGIHSYGSGMNAKHRDPDDECRYVEIRNCYLHDAGWNSGGTEGYGFAANGSLEFLVIEHCQIDNNSGDGILYEAWTIQSMARHNVIRGTGIAAIWIDNASMALVEGNYLEANNVAMWLSGEDGTSRLLSDSIAIRNNIIVHNDWTAIPTSVYGKTTILFTSNTRDISFENNTVAFNNCEHVIDLRARPPFTHRNIWFRNNIFWQNTGGVGIGEGLDAAQLHFANNLWDKPYPADAQAKVGDPLFVDPHGHTPEDYRLQDGSAAKEQGLLLYENPVDFWNAPRPHLSDTERCDLGAHEYAASGSAYAGLDRSSFPYEVPPFQFRFGARPPREAR